MQIVDGQSTAKRKGELDVKYKKMINWLKIKTIIT